MTDLIDVTRAHISRTPGVAGGKPCIAGRRIRVQDVYLWHELLGMSVPEIAAGYNLSYAQIFAALTYAFEHLDAIKDDMREDDRLLEQIAQQYPSKMPN